MENLAVLLGKGGGENEKLMFRVLKRGAELERPRAGGGELADLALRFDLTVPLARYYATHRAALPAVFKRYQIGPVWRAERAAVRALPRVRAVRRRRARLGVDGRRGGGHPRRRDRARRARLRRPRRAPELAPSARSLVRSCGVPDDAPRRRRRRHRQARQEDAGTIRGELAAKGVPDAAAAALLDLHARSRTADGGDAAARGRGARRRGGRRVGGGAPRGAGAHTAAAVGARSPSIPSSPAASTTTPAPSSRSPPPACPSASRGGGRFDELVERLSGARVPACGFSIGFERVYTLMEERGMFGGAARAADVLVAVPRAEALGDAIRLAAELRARRLARRRVPAAGEARPAVRARRAEGDPVRDRRRSRTTLAAGTLEVRDLATRQSTPVARAELAAWLRDHLAPAGA